MVALARVSRLDHYLRSLTLGPRLGPCHHIHVMKPHDMSHFTSCHAMPRHASHSDARSMPERGMSWHVTFDHDVFLGFVPPTSCRAAVLRCVVLCCVQGLILSNAMLYPPYLKDKIEGGGGLRQ